MTAGLGAFVMRQTGISYGRSAAGDAVAFTGRGRWGRNGMKTERKTPRRAASPISVAADSYVDRAYEQLKEAAINFGFKPGERLNEIDLAKRIGISRTPLREALHRLNTEGFLKFIPGKGFFCRDLDPKEIFDLYELRKVIELGALRL